MRNRTMSPTTQTASPPSFDWKRWPETEAFVDDLIAAALDGNAFAAELSGRMKRETGTSFKVWVDHILIRGGSTGASKLAALGYQREPIVHSVGVPVYGHPGGIFPRIALSLEDGAAAASITEIAIKVESLPAFSQAHDLGLAMVGYPMGPYRIGRVSGKRTTLSVVERRAYRGFEPFP